MFNSAVSYQEIEKRERPLTRVRAKPHKRDCDGSSRPSTQEQPRTPVHCSHLGLCHKVPRSHFTAHNGHQGDCTSGAAHENADALSRRDALWCHCPTLPVGAEEGDVWHTAGRGEGSSNRREVPDRTLTPPPSHIWTS
ncbi:hypothetical protein AAFF_G00045140 [Aldrovandia affinis]|uniref:Uncharacterized protein n=1 Tax=Aldrovandia affinis TaxID=143900 RepID=A0AAD7S202_9TELE|nr:hypothetical protein AAFF_G00045140 [Aldrovandia affinis]